MSSHRNNHYVPVWYQKRFLAPTAREQKYYYLDLAPERITRDGHTYTRDAVRRLGPINCFSQDDLYTTRLGNWISTDIERLFFGRVDREAGAAVEYWTTFEHPSVHRDHFNTLLRYLSLQKLRTPKGLAQLTEFVGNRDRNSVLYAMQKLHSLYGAVWAEAVWCILDASKSETKFIISDHPVTTYNSACLPASLHCRGHRDPKVTFNASHTLFPLSAEKLLVLTNLSWAKNPYRNPTEERPNPLLIRNSGLFNFHHVQMGRLLSEDEVREVNYVIKSRAKRFVAAGQREWLFPEEHVGTTKWEKLGEGYLFMPDPRDVETTVESFVKYSSGKSEAWDPYGRQPGQAGYGKPASDDDWDALLAFQGEYSRAFGPRRRGRAFRYGKLSDEEDSPEHHASNLRLEASNKGKIRRYRK